MITQGQVGLVALALLTVILGQDGKSQHRLVKLQAPLVVRADDGNVVYSVDVYHNLILKFYDMRFDIGIMLYAPQR